MFFKNLLTMCSVRLSVRTCGFHPHKRSSILLPSTILKYIGLPTPVGILVSVIAVDGLPLLGYKKDGNEAERLIRWSRWVMLKRNVCERQVRGRHGRAGSKLLFLSNIPMYFNMVVGLVVRHSRLVVRRSDYHSMQVSPRWDASLPSCAEWSSILPTCSICLVLSGYRDLINHYSGPTGEGRILT